jgi:hypothetical protein
MSWLGIAGHSRSNPRGWRRKHGGAKWDASRPWVNYTARRLGLGDQTLRRQRTRRARPSPATVIIGSKLANIEPVSATSNRVSATATPRNRKRRPETRRRNWPGRAENSNKCAGETALGRANQRECRAYSCNPDTRLRDRTAWLTTQFYTNRSPGWNSLISGKNTGNLLRKGR